ncbi:hypothetical protein KE639_01056 [Streptomyces sp. V17-9]|nr:hypothetical protein KE639_01056 [Streptomyces sp. V17-9]
MPEHRTIAGHNGPELQNVTSQPVDEAVHIGVRALAAIDDTQLPTEHPVLDQLRETYLAIPGEKP